jgi:hypothetical protein
MPTKGIAAVRKRYKITVDRIASKQTEGAIFAILSQGAAYATLLTPMDTGYLANSQYAPQITVKRGKVSGIVGYTASYALAVANMPGKLKGQPRGHFGRTGAGVDFGGGTGKGNYWDPNAEPDFLAKGFEAIKPAIPQILRASYRVTGI